MREINVSLAAMPGLRTLQACIETLSTDGSTRSRLSEPVFGTLVSNHVQLVPQNFGLIDEDVCTKIMAAWPGTQFRLHANVRVMRDHRMADLSGFDTHKDWFCQAATISKFIKAPAYSAHGGRRNEASMAEMLDNARRAADLFGVPVAVEGQYPMKGDTMLCSHWDEYRMLFDSGVPYAVDLSHLHILSSKTKKFDKVFVSEMLSSDRCLEVHISDNDGSGDWHAVCCERQWWFDLLDKAHPDAVIFSEGNHRSTKYSFGINNKQELIQ